MSRQAYTSLRVVDALFAVANHLEEAAKSAARIPAGQVAKLTLEHIHRDLGPSLRKVSWEDPGNNRNTLVVIGSGLADAKIFKLVKGHEEIAAHITPVDAHQFVATFHDDLPVGTYDAWVADELGQAFFLPGAFAVEPEKDPVPVPATTDDLGNCAMFPNVIEAAVRQAAPHAVHVALILGREANHDVDVYVEQNGNPLQWPVEIVDNVDPWAGVDVPERLVRLRMTIPDKTHAGLYHLVVTSQVTQSQVKLVFHVR